MKILAIGDVTGIGGVKHLEANLWRVRDREKIDLVIVNVENAGFITGPSPDTAVRVLDAGADVLSGGNHTMRKKNIYSMLDDEGMLIRPANYPSRSPGVGHVTVDVYGYRILVVNLAGQVYMDTHAVSPFDCLERILESESGRYDAVIVDIHAEATSEKLALARCFAGRVSAVVGTHTHIPTADIRIIDGYTGYITDLGMCGSQAGVLGVRSDEVIRKFLSVVPVTFVPAEGEMECQGAVFTIELPSGKCVSAEAVRF